MCNTCQVARQIIAKVCAETPGDQDCDFRAAVAQAFPIGPGGVGHANRKIQREVLAAIDAFYAPREAAEPDARHGW